MKILAICHYAGSGISIIYERLIAYMSQYADVDVLSDYSPKSCEGKVNNIYTLPYTRRMLKWNRKLLRWFGILPVSEWWTRKAVKQIGDDYDVVIAFVASSQLMPTVCAKYVSQKLGCKMAIYAVDAIPGPGGWTKPMEYRSKLKAVKNYFSATDYMASSNKHMLAFQLSTFTHKPGLMSNVLLTPSPDAQYIYPISSENLFLYTGSLYGLRNATHIIKAFKRILTVYPDAQFIFIGVKMKLDAVKKYLTAEERTHIHIMKATNDLGPLIKRAKVLVDIDADRNKDPFLSSKIITYIKTNRMIICETGKITPSREMFAGLNTIIQCDHDADSLYEGMKRALEMGSVEQDYSEREHIIEQFSIERVGSILRDDLRKLCGEAK